MNSKSYPEEYQKWLKMDLAEDLFNTLSIKEIKDVLSRKHIKGSGRGTSLQRESIKTLGRSGSYLSNSDMLDGLGEENLSQLLEALKTVRLSTIETFRLSGTKGVNENYKQMVKIIYAGLDKARKDFEHLGVLDED